MWLPNGRRLLWMKVVTYRLPMSGRVHLLTHFQQRGSVWVGVCVLSVPSEGQRTVSLFDSHLRDFGQNYRILMLFLHGVYRDQGDANVP